MSQTWEQLDRLLPKKPIALSAEQLDRLLPKKPIALSAEQLDRLLPRSVLVAVTGELWQRFSVAQDVLGVDEWSVTDQQRVVLCWCVWLITYLLALRVGLAALQDGNESLQLAVGIGIVAPGSAASLARKGAERLLSRSDD